MWRFGIFWKLYVGYLSLILLAMTIVGSLVYRQIERSSRREIRGSLERQAILARSIADPILRREQAYSQKDVVALGKELGTRITIIAMDGTVLADANADPEGLDDHSTRPEVKEAAKADVGVSERFSDTLNEKMMYVATMVYQEEKPIGYVRTSLPLSDIKEQLASLRNNVVFGTVVAIAVALLLGLVMANHFCRPLTSMTEIAEAMAKGDYDQKVEVSQEDEIGRLARSVNRMADKCRERLETIITDRNELETVLAALGEGVVAVDDQTEVTHLNENAARLLGVSKEDLSGHSLTESAAPTEIKDLVKGALAGTADHEVEQTLSVGDRELQCYASTLVDHDGHAVGAVVVLTDLTRLHRLETIRQDFVANASHELKTPITAIRGMAETLADITDMEDADRREFLKRICNQSLRLSSIVTDLMALSRLEGEGQPMARERFDLADAVSNAARPLAPVAEEKGITLNLELSDDPIHLIGDREAILQAVSNLIDNALKYTGEGGVVDVGLTIEQKAAHLRVKDTGIGIGQEHQERIFERFYRVDKARSRALGGTGLGLSIVKRTALAHGGDVSVSSTVGEGSEFRLQIPIAST